MIQLVKMMKIMHALTIHKHACYAVVYSKHSVFRDTDELGPFIDGSEICYKHLPVMLNNASCTLVKHTKNRNKT
jgi:hypothetical protein